MRVNAIVMALPLLVLAACSGAGPETVGSVAPPSGSTGTGSTGSGGSGGGVSPTPGATPTPTPSANFLSGLTTETSFSAIGAMHSFDYTTVNNVTYEQYQGNASTVNAPSGTITYSPRDGIFSIAFNDTKAGVADTITFQDPAHRADYNPENTPVLEAPNLAGFNYLEAGDATQRATFFYQRPDATTYVTLAGFTRTANDATGVTKREHGVFVFGSLTPQAQVPISGTASYTGGFLASAVLNTDYLQWIAGNSTINVDFGKSTVGLGFTGAIGTTFRDGAIVPDASLIYPSGTAFTATGHATIDLLRSGGFSGVFDSAKLGADTINFSGINAGSNVAGASSIDGAFFGPGAVNVGGNFRIVGGVPGQRVDIQGAFTGAKK